MHFLSADLEEYAEAHTTGESDVLQRLNRNTHAYVMRPRMLSGQLQGRFLSMISRMMRPRRILEIGTYTGYSALCLAEGLTDDGLLITVDNNEELESFARSYWNQTPYTSKIDFRLGNAPDIIPTLNDVFDIVFIDADKKNYSLYYDLVFDKVRSGGIILADNVLWSGKVVPAGRPASRAIDKDTQAVLDFNQKVQQDSRAENVLLPVRDGLMMIYKQ
ncbi:O-methyltransferase [Tellurirhabdus bombi]|uniref:O-methyltransferase n=1 Tax=Tellurirhabdus bombi TaxID=2907205 RepID=UPI001F456715|nr:O-methyltransferase [Tellurirhabdus bombi]